MPISLALAGSTEKSLVCAQTILDDPQLDLDWVLTPSPRPIGRQQKKQKNLIHQLAESLEIPALLVENKIDNKIKQGAEVLEKPDMLLVVDFGYFLPNWLIKLPQLKTLNIHPSALPAWRGSSPGQFVILSGQKTSGVSLIEVTDQLDQGSIYWQAEFAVDPNWTQTEYYQVSFGIIAEELASLLKAIESKELSPQPQPLASPTPEARRLEKEDAFVDWSIIEAAQSVKNSPAVRVQLKPANLNQDQTLLMNLIKETQAQFHPQLIKQATQAFSPWPRVWTKLPTAKGPRRMQLLETGLKENGQLELAAVKVAGLDETPWNQVKNLVEK